MPKLLLKFNAAVLKEIPLDRAHLTVGRKPDNDLVVDNPAISGHHCRFTFEGDTYYVEDLDSTNGTYLNEKRIKKAGVHNNDVVSIAKHSLVFVEDAPQAGAGAGKGGEEPAAVAVAPKQDEPAVAASPAKAPAGKIGCLRVLKGVVDQPEYELKGTSTYIGKSDRVQIQVKGAGLFGSAPEVAASIHRKAEGYVLVAVAEGYPLLNGGKVQANVVLKEGDLIECGGTTMQFFMKEA